VIATCVSLLGVVCVCVFVNVGFALFLSVCL
jgi:hypothetical protein